MSRLWPLGLVLAGCSDIRGLGNDAQLFDAELRAVHMWGMAVIGGAWAGEARLEADTSDGYLEVPVRLRGSNLGLGLELQVTSHGRLSMWVPDDAVVDDLFGRYHGSSAHVGILYGVESHNLQNSAGIELHGPASTGSVALMWGAEWMSIEARDTEIPDATQDLVDSGEEQ